MGDWRARLLRDLAVAKPGLIPRLLRVVYYALLVLLGGVLDRCSALW